MHKFQLYLINALLLIILSLPWLSYADTGEIRKPAKDKREYRALRLENGLNVFLIHDHNAENATAVLSVGAGGFQDPKSRQGLAHFLEHMILIQSEKYPETNGLRAFVEANGGWTNAYTSGLTTDYIASASHHMFEPLLDRLSAAIHAPVFDSAYVEKEVNAIDAEWHRQNQTNGFYFSRVLAETSNKRHPFNKLTVGNRKTLLGRRSHKLSDDLKQFHQRYYSSNIMNLVLAGPQSLEDLETLSRRYFSGIENKATEIADIKQPIFKNKHLGKHIYVSTKGNVSGLIMQFSVPKIEAPWRNKSYTYLRMLLNSKQKGSLTQVLKEAGLIRNMQTDISVNGVGSDSLIDLSFELTEEGSSNKNTIIATTFDFISLLRNEGVNKQRERQVAKQIQRSREQYVPTRLGRSAIRVARGLHTIPPEHVIYAPYFFKGIDEHEIRRILSAMKPEAVRLWSTGPDLETSKTIKDAFGSYAIKKIPKVQKANWQGEGLETSLAKVEGDVAAERVFKVAFDETYKEPQVVYDRFNIRAILAHSESFQDEEGYLTLVLRNPFTAESVDNWVYSSLLQQIVEEQNQAFQESERINSGAIISTTMDTFGNTTFTVYGKSQHHKRILLTLLKRFKALAITERELANSQLGMRNFFNNLDSYSARQQLSFYRSEISETFQIFNRDDILNALSDVDIDSLLETHKVISQDSFVDIFAMGNYGKENLVALVDEVKTLFPEREGIQNWRFESPFSVNPSQQLSYNIDMLQKGIAIADIYISPEKSASLAAQVYVLSFMMSEPFHSSLRTEQQLGYAVSLWTSPLHDYPAITFRIESNSASLPELKERIANFIADYRETLESYNEDDLAQLRQAIIADAFRAPNSLLEEVDSLLSDWAQDNLNFDTIDKTQQVIGRVTKQDLLALYDKLFSSESANFMVQLKGIDYIDSEFFD